eukprot:CAMPEP_0119275204 /NCGR_PEP_ID=MMETSP1329-20130426/13442_1 /TAXON_ID=114041 /ORGANISM="Genus nov. species nov., Strain RCC1024" /LENGTH=120 /DNA_ID=CAMNT_0007275571 /DNA_START=170 /DNA_END=529 /DNA_ORIENTATION=-
MASEADIKTFKATLAAMAGTKESIKQAKEWLLARPAHAGTLAVALREHVVTCPDFQKVLFAVYLLNDVFFGTSAKDPFRKDFFPQLPTVIHHATQKAPDDASKEKVRRVVELWGAKKVFP